MRRSIACLLAAGTLAWGCPLARAQLDPSRWRVVSFSSENTATGELARHAIDRDPETQWHTQWHDPRKSPTAAPPHHLTLDLGRVERIQAVRYRARAHGEGGLPGTCRLELSRDGTTWTTAAEEILAFRSSMSPHAVIALPTPVPARFLRFTVLSLRDSPRATDPGLVVGELEVATPDHPLVPTTRLPVPQSREWNYGGYHWRTRHESILALARERRPRLLFLGDSITHQWGGPPQDVTPKPGHSVWEESYGSRNALCLGYGWDRIENMLWRVQHGELDEADPRLVVILAGTNNLEVNTPAEIADGLSSLCREVHRRKPRTRILLLGILPRGDNPRNPSIEEANQRTRAAVARLRHVTFKDIGPAFLNGDGPLSREIMPDLLHLSAEGYRRWAHAIEPEVASALGENADR